MAGDLASELLAANCASHWEIKTRTRDNNPAGIAKSPDV